MYKYIACSVSVDVYPFDGGQHRVGTRDGWEKLDLGPGTTIYHEVDHGSGYDGYGLDDTHYPQRPPVLSAWEPYMWNPQSLMDNTRRLFDIASQTPLNPHHRRVTILGDHSMAAATTLASLHRFSGDPVYVVMVDAHGDVNSPEISPSGNCHGMWLGAMTMGTELLYASHPAYANGMKIIDLEELRPLINFGEKPFAYRGKTWLPQVAPLHPRNLTMFGTTSLDSLEAVTLHAYKLAGARVYTPEDIEHLGVERVLSELQSQLGGQLTHLSLDVDVTSNVPCEGQETGMQCTGTPEGKVPFPVVKRFLEGVRDMSDLVGADMSEMNPRLRPEHLEGNREMWQAYFDALTRI
ncbi:MAG: arginase family protein [Candidatus Margulisiibacteriota bacterium]